MLEPESVGSHQKLEGARNKCSPGASRKKKEGKKTVVDFYTLILAPVRCISDFWPLELSENKFVLF